MDQKCQKVLFVFNWLDIQSRFGVPTDKKLQKHWISSIELSPDSNSSFSETADLISSINLWIDGDL